MALITIKTGVIAQGLHKCILYATFVAAGVFSGYGVDTLVLTSARDGQHIDQSLHYDGRAIDIRIWDVEDNKEEVAGEIETKLGPYYDVILEPDHLHIEYEGETDYATQCYIDPDRRRN